YGILIGLGIVAALTYAIVESRRRGMDTEVLYDLGFWIVLCGILGARLYYVIFEWELYARQPLESLFIWRGGLAIHGGLIGGVLALVVFARIKKISVPAYMDILAPGLILAQAVGRWGNFFNSEAFGRPTDLPWKLFIPLQSRPTEFIASEYFHPTFLYESMWNLLVFVLLVIVTRRIYHGGSGRPAGAVFSWYLILYSLGRFFVESFRTDSLMLGSLRAAQVVSLALFIAGLVGIYLTRAPRSSDTPPTVLRQ
ncbi:MAG: prolipoprotein diacylglyceryl transferase, partial [Patescibacteria group bacterium]